MKVTQGSNPLPEGYYRYCGVLAERDPTKSVEGVRRVQLADRWFDAPRFADTLLEGWSIKDDEVLREGEYRVVPWSDERRFEDLLAEKYEPNSTPDQSVTIRRCEVRTTEPERRYAIRLSGVRFSMITENSFVFAASRPEPVRRSRFSFWDALRRLVLGVDG